MDRIVRTRIYYKGNLIADDIIEPVDFSKCRVERDYAENGVVVETFHSCQE
jgi:hypothetical protein